MIILLIWLLLMQPAMAEPLQGGVSYNETMKDEHGTRVVDWDTWIYNFRCKLGALFNSEGTYRTCFMRGDRFKFAIKINRNGDVQAFPDSKDAETFPFEAQKIKDAATSLAHTDCVVFPEGTHRNKVCFWNKSDGGPLGTNWHVTFQNGFNEKVR